MTLREKLADWISGGRLTLEIERADECRDLFHKYYDLSEAYETALRKIAEQETTSVKASYECLARIAREALK